MKQFNVKAKMLTCQQTNPHGVEMRVPNCLSWPVQSIQILVVGTLALMTSRLIMGETDFSSVLYTTLDVVCDQTG